MANDALEKAEETKPDADATKRKYEALDDDDDDEPVVKASMFLEVFPCPINI